MKGRHCMAYSILLYDPIRTVSNMGEKYKHNDRLYDVKNADPQRTHLNEYLVSTNGKSYERVYKDTYEYLRVSGSQKRKVKSGAIIGFEIMIRFSKEVYSQKWEDENGKFDEEGWKKESLRWLHETFNPPDNIFMFDDASGQTQTGFTDNVKAAVVHYDEVYPHIHAFIIPVDDKGKINANYYVNRETWREWHDSFNETMKQFHLLPGEKYSVATPEQHARYQNEIVKAVSPGLPDVMEGETAREYKERAERTFIREKCQHRDDVVKMNQAVVKAKSHETIAVTKADALKKEINSSRLFFKQAIGKETPSEDEMRRVIISVKEVRDMEKMLDEYPDQEFAGTIRNGLEEIQMWYHRKEEKEKRKNRQEKEGPLFKTI